MNLSVVAVRKVGESEDAMEKLGMEDTDGGQEEYVMGKGNGGFI